MRSAAFHLRSAAAAFLLDLRHSDGEMRARCPPLVINAFTGVRGSAAMALASSAPTTSGSRAMARAVPVQVTCCIRGAAVRQDSWFSFDQRPPGRESGIVLSWFVLKYSYPALTWWRPKRAHCSDPNSCNGPGARLLCGEKGGNSHRADRLGKQRRSPPEVRNRFSRRLPAVDPNRALTAFSENLTRKAHRARGHDIRARWPQASARARGP